ncbi:MAG: hypothetical protein K5739_11075 [Lachnospiraceae bacterium]|nr:hypothetical protein [Lachnospiraceae bacterium]
MDTRKIPPLVTLTAALAASIVTYLGHYELKRSLVIILCVILGFNFLGNLIKILFDKLGMNIETIKQKEEEKRKAEEEQKENEEKAKLENEDGSVREKEEATDRLGE